MIEEFKRLNINYEENMDLTNYNTMRLECMCYVMVHPKSVSELKSILLIIKKYKTKYFVIGNGSNIILPEYYDGVIIKLDNMKKMICKSGNIYVEAGCMLNKLASKLSLMGYTGLEWATGIPATIGGAIYSNAGAYKSSMSDIVISAIVFDGNNIIEYSNSEMKFDYRNSIFKHNSDLIVLSCNIKLKNDDVNEIKSLINERTKRRVETQPLEYPSCGSVFRNPIDIPAGKLIEDANLKGYKIGGAVVSKKHANFIINVDNATSKDIIKLIKYIKKEVYKKYRITLILEQEIIK